MAAKRDDAWVISPHRIDSLLCKYSTTIFLVNDVSLLFIISPKSPGPHSSIFFFFSLFYLSNLNDFFVFFLNKKLMFVICCAE